MRYELEIFGHGVADGASMCLAHCPEKLHELFDQFKVNCGGDLERLAIVGDIEVMAQDFAGKLGLGGNFHDVVKNVERPAETSVRTEVRRKRKPNLDKLIAKAKAAGARSVVVEGVEMRFGESGANPAHSEPPRHIM
jgi:hypothetical protein